MPSTADRSVVTARQLVVQTYVVPTKDRVTTDHYQIHLAPDDSPDAPRTVLVTRHVEAYVLASVIEGTGARVNARWHHGVRDGKRCMVLDLLETAA